MHKVWFWALSGSLSTVCLKTAAEGDPSAASEAYFCLKCEGGCNWQTQDLKKKSGGGLQEPQLARQEWLHALLSASLPLGQADHATGAAAWDFF